MKQELRIRITELIKEYENLKQGNSGTRDFLLNVSIDLLREILELEK